MKEDTCVLDDLSSPHNLLLPKYFIYLGTCIYFPAFSLCDDFSLPLLLISCSSFFIKTSLHPFQLANMIIICFHSSDYMGVAGRNLWLKFYLLVQSCLSYGKRGCTATMILSYSLLRLCPLKVNKDMNRKR